MKTEFTDKEIYETYKQEILEEMLYYYKIQRRKAEFVIKKENFEIDFLENMENYEFVEPSKIAEELVFKYASFFEIKKIYNENTGETKFIKINSSRGRRRVKNHSSPFLNRNKYNVKSPRKKKIPKSTEKSSENKQFH